MRKVLLLTLGWVLTIFGAVLCVTPVPVPLIGLLPLGAGLAFLIENSRTMRRAIQRMRHRVRWFSHMLEHFTHRGPKTLGRILHRSHPAPIARKERFDARGQTENKD
ncbi:MAG: hypothetical protein WDM86_12555 [Rhizomicrobium sp.]